MMCVKAWVVDIVPVDNVSVDGVSVWGPVLLLVHRAGRFCRISLSIAAQVVWTRSVLELERVWWSLTVVVVEEDMMIGAAWFVLPWDVICCYIFDEVGGRDWGLVEGGVGEREDREGRDGVFLGNVMNQCQL